jgi:hypothetical protein
VLEKICSLSFVACKIKIWLLSEHFLAFRHVKSGRHRPMILGRQRRRWEDNIKMDLQEVGGGRGDWMELAQDRDRWRALVGMVREFRLP